MTGPDDATPKLPAVLAYEDAKRLAADQDPAVRAAVAARPDVQPEILYYLAGDPDAAVREAVAANAVTPAHAAEVLVLDVRAEVRAALGRRLAQLLPDLDAGSRSRMRDVAAAAVETLASDQAEMVRVALAETLKDVARVPPRIAFDLARDVERAVAEPMLLCCAAIPDEHLLEILRADPEGWRVEAIAARPAVSGEVSAAVVQTGNAAAAEILVRNPKAEILPPTMDAIVEMAEARPSLQDGLARRPRLPEDAVRRLARFAERSVLRALAERDDLDPETAADVAEVMRRRIVHRASGDPDEPAHARVQRINAEGRLDEAAVSDALAWDDREFAVHALALRARVPAATVEAVLAADSPRAITALAWRAGLSMRTAIQLQLKAGIPARRTLPAKGGTDYPLGEVEMIWHLELFGIRG